MTGFFAELRRRGVAKAAAVYAVVAWAVIEASSVIFPALQLPEWTVTFVVLLALLGFPVMLSVAWVFDWTRDGIVRTEAPSGGVPPGRGRALDFIVIAALLAVIGWLGWERAFDDDGAPARAALDSIAVLPFVNLSGDPENEYFGDGLAEELLNTLVRIDGLRVAARTSSFQYKDQNVDVRRIGEALNVATVLEGSVRKAGERVRVTAQLIRADDGFHLWSDTYDVSLEDIFAVQDRIALAIADAFRIRLQANERARIVAHHTRDVEAFEAYLRGRYEMNRRTAASLERAIDEFRAAIARDPRYAAAYSGLSDSWILSNNYGGVSVEEAARNAEPMARRALELDPELAEAHASMGLVLRHRGEVAASVEPLRRATELNPSYSPAYHWLGLTYQALGRFNDAVELLRKAVEVDPHYVTGKRALLGSLRMVGRDAEADAYARRIASEHPDDAMLLYGLAGDAMSVGRRLDALRHAVAALRIDPSNIAVRAHLAYLLIGMDDVARADEQVAIVRRLNPTLPALETWAADRAVVTGDLDAARVEVSRVHDAMPASRQRDAYACATLQIAGRAAEAAAACRAMLEREGWRAGEPLPEGTVEAAAGLLFAAKALDDRRTTDELLPAFRQEFERLAETGLVRDEIRWAQALIAAHTGEGTDLLLEVLPRRLERGSWNWRQLRSSVLFEPVRDDPRFAALVSELRARNERERAEAAAITIPGV